MSRGAVIVLHQAIMSVHGPAEMHRAAHLEGALVDVAQLRVLVHRTGRPAREVREWLRYPGTTFSAEDALRARLVDEIAEQPAIAGSGEVRTARGRRRRSSTGARRRHDGNGSPPEGLNAGYSSPR